MAYISCGSCNFCVDGVCKCNLSDRFMKPVSPQEDCYILRTVSRTVCYNFTNSLTDSRAVRYADYIKTKFPDKTIGNISVYRDADPEFVILAYEEFPRNYIRIKRIKE